MADDLSKLRIAAMPTLLIYDISHRDIQSSKMYAIDWVLAVAEFTGPCDEIQQQEHRYGAQLTDMR